MDSQLEYRVKSITTTRWPGAGEHHIEVAAVLHGRAVRIGIVDDGVRVDCEVGTAYVQVGSQRERRRLRVLRTRLPLPAGCSSPPGSRRGFEFLFDVARRHLADWLSSDRTLAGMQTHRARASAREAAALYGISLTEAEALAL